MGYINVLENNLIEAVRTTGQDLSYKVFNFGNTELKSDQDPVTRLDRETEKNLKEKISQLGEFSFVGEEHGQTKNTNSRYTAHIDPIDGTKSFVFQEFNSSIGIGIEDNHNPGKAIIGIVYDFMKDLMYIGSKNNGLTLLHRGKEVSQINRKTLPSKKRILLEGTLNEITPIFQFLEENGFSPYHNKGSFLLSMAQVGFQTYDGFISFPNKKMMGKTWDVAAGTVILEQREKIGENFKFRSYNKDKKYDLNHPESGFSALDLDVWDFLNEKIIIKNYKNQ